jgi:hypothetical protein
MLGVTQLGSRQEIEANYSRWRISLHRCLRKSRQSSNSLFRFAKMEDRRRVALGKSLVARRRDCCVDRNRTANTSSSASCFVSGANFRVVMYACAWATALFITATAARRGPSVAFVGNGADGIGLAGASAMARRRLAHSRRSAASMLTSHARALRMFSSSSRSTYVRPPAYAPAFHEATPPSKAMSPLRKASSMSSLAPGSPYLIERMAAACSKLIRSPITQAPEAERRCWRRACLRRGWLRTRPMPQARRASRRGSREPDTRRRCRRSCPMCGSGRAL